MSSITSLTQHNRVLRHVRDMQEQMARYQNQIDTGRKGERYGDLGGPQAQLSLSLRSTLTRLAGYRDTMQLLDMRAARADAAMNVMGADTQVIRDAAYQLRIKGISPPEFLAKAEEAFTKFVGEMNANIDGHYVFAGARATQPPVRPPAAMLAEIRGLIADAIADAPADDPGVPTPPGGPPPGTPLTMAHLRSIVEEYFNSATPVWADPGSPTAPVHVSDSLTLAPPTMFDPADANDPFRRAVVELALLAVVDPTDEDLVRVLDYGGTPAPPSYPLPSPPPEEFRLAALYRHQDFAEDASDRLASAVIGNGVGASVRGVSASNGHYRALLDRELRTQEAFRVATETDIGEIENADPAEALMRLTEVRTRLEATYRLTGELRGLSLTNYL